MHSIRSHQPTNQHSLTHSLLSALSLTQTNKQNKQTQDGPTNPADVTPAVLAKTYNIAGVTPKNTDTNRMAVAEFQNQNEKDSDLVAFFKQFVPNAQVCVCCVCQCQCQCQCQCKTNDLDLDLDLDLDFDFDLDLDFQPPICQFSQQPMPIE